MSSVVLLLANVLMLEGLLGPTAWRAEFSSGTNRENRLTLRGDFAAAERSVEEGRWTFRWKNLSLGDERDILEACVRIEERADGSEAWRLEFSNRSTTWALLSTDFPIIKRLGTPGGCDVMLPWKDHGAQLFKGYRGKSYTYNYLGYFPMVAATFTDGKGVYIAAEDPDARIKSMIVGDDLSLLFRTPIEWGGVVGKAAEGPRYSVVFAPLTGDWWSAANRYRQFALRQKWCAKGPIKAQCGYPRRLCEIPLWINVHCLPAQASNVLARAKAVFPDFTTGLHWHLWQHSGHDVNYPEYFPAQPGTKEALAFFRSIGQEAMPYTNGRLWSASTSGYLMAEPYVTMNDMGVRPVEKYAPWTPPLAVMCPKCPAWQRVLKSFSCRILDELGATSLFVDQIGAAEAQVCYDASHPHPVGGGDWWYEGYEQALRPIREAYNAKSAFLTTEGGGEAYIGMLDGYLQVVERTPEDVPFMNAVYSGYTTYFCSPENTDDSVSAFRALQSRELLWGNSLGWFLQDVLEKPDKCAVLRELCAFRQANLDALAYGNLLDELRFEGPVGVQKYEWLGRRPHYRLFDKTFKLPPSSFATMPDVIGNWWRTAEGEIVLLAANLTDRPQRVTCRSFGGQGGTFELALAPFELRRVTP